MEGDPVMMAEDDDDDSDELCMHCHSSDHQEYLLICGTRGTLGVQVGRMWVMLRGWGEEEEGIGLPRRPASACDKTHPPAAGLLLCCGPVPLWVEALGAPVAELRKCQSGSFPNCLPAKETPNLISSYPPRRTPPLPPPPGRHSCLLLLTPTPSL